MCQSKKKKGKYKRFDNRQIPGYRFLTKIKKQKLKPIRLKKKKVKVKISRKVKQNPKEKSKILTDKTTHIQ